MCTTGAMTPERKDSDMTHAVSGTDVLDFIDARGLKRLDACWLLGITPWRFGKVVTDQPQAPLRNPSTSILLRLITQWPELDPLPSYPKPREVYERVNALEPRISLRVFGMALGCNPSWASAKVKQPDYSSPVIDRLLWWLDRRLQAAESPEQGQQIIWQWLDLARAEWQARGDHRLDFVDV